MITLAPVAADLPALDSVCDDAMVALIYADEKPPRGLAGLIDWRTDAAISRMAAGGRINGEYGECVLFSTNNRTACGFILFFGLGRKRELTLERLRNAAAIVGSKLHKANVKRFALGLPPADEDRIAWPEALAIFLGAIAEAGPWESVTIIDDPDKVKKFSWTMPEGLKKKYVLARAEGDSKPR
jgi:hypothetical protein